MGYVTAVLVVGLTGGLGAGKSAVGRALAARGATVIDADEVARQVLAPGSPGEGAVLEYFGPGVVGPHHSLDRAALARLVFSSPTDRLALEAISHPLIGEEVARRIGAARSAGAQVAVIELPLLDAARRRQYDLDAVVLVDTPEDVAVARAVGRGMPEPDARARMAAQPSAEERRSLADWTVANDRDLAALERQVDELWHWLTSRAGA